MKKFIITTMVVAAVAIFGFSGCVSGGGGAHRTPNAPLAGARLFVTTSDFVTGGTAVIYGTPPAYGVETATSVSSDAAAKVYGNWVFVVNRFLADNIQPLDGLAGFRTYAQYSMGNGTNPQDIVLSSPDKAFVTRYQDPDGTWGDIWVGNPFTGATVREIDLSGYADADGVPEASRMVLVNNRLFVALQMLDSANWFAPTAKSSIAVIDTDNNTLVTVIDLATTNPVSRLIYNPADSKIYVGCAGGFQSFGYPPGDGGLETITVDTVNDTYTPNGVVLGEGSLAGDISHLAVVSSTQAYIVVSEFVSFNPWQVDAHLVRINPQTGAVGAILYTTSAFIADMILDADGYLYIADRDAVNPGIRVWDTATDTELTAAAGPIDTGLPPYWLALVQ